MVNYKFRICTKTYDALIIIVFLVHFSIIYRKNILSGSVLFTVLFEAWSLDQSECTNITHSKTQFLAESSLNMWIYIYMIIFITF